MGLKGKIIGQTVVKHSGVGDAFHDLFIKAPHNVKNVSPQKIQGFTLLAGGGIGVPGSKICWNYFHGTYILKLFVHTDFFLLLTKG